MNPRRGHSTYRTTSQPATATALRTGPKLQLHRGHSAVVSQHPVRPVELSTRHQPHHPQPRRPAGARQAHAITRMASVTAHDTGHTASHQATDTPRRHALEVYSTSVAPSPPACAHPPTCRGPPPAACCTGRNTARWPALCETGSPTPQRRQARQRQRRQRRRRHFGGERKRGPRQQCPLRGRV